MKIFGREILFRKSKDAKPKTYCRSMGSKLSFTTSYSLPPRTFSTLSEYFQIYATDASVFAAVNYTAYNTVMTGYSLFGDEPYITIIKNFINSIDFNKILLENTINTLIFGDAFIEIIRNELGEIVNLKTIDPTTMYIETDKYGLVSSYYQMINGQRLVDLKPDDVIHIRFFPIPSSQYGLSLIQPSLDLIKKKRKTEESIVQAIMRHGSPKWKITINTKEGTQIPSQEIIDEIEREFEDINARSEFVVLDTIDIEPIDVKGVENVNEYFNYFQELLVVGMMCPQEMLGLGSNSTEATAKTRAIMYERMISCFQSYLESAIENNLFNKILNESGKVKIRFKGTTDIDEAKKAEWLAKVLSAYDDIKPFSINEIREMFGYPPTNQIEKAKLSKYLVEFTANKMNVIEKSQVKIYKDCLLIKEGTFTDGGTGRPHLFSSSILRQSVELSKGKPIYLNIDHESDKVLYRIGKVLNIKYKDKSIYGDIAIFTGTNAGKDAVALIDNDYVNGLSIEAEIEDEYDNTIKNWKVKKMELIGLSLVTNPACKEAKIK